ncbi:SKP1/ASK1-interacting protein 2 [Artemisia annua]|uniref:SKP1/ASK1-interacting protein 2 n=1 Tax=Artemisia annua TaxID=35608 RepID=A0A2U1Q707_ARTAN|nr:SKP1/ASK1-interacting protein 2 [Artemisia annua]
MYHRHRRVDYTNSLPDECLALIFNYLITTNDRNNSSLVSHRWFRIEAQTRTYLTLKAHSNLQPFILSIFNRFNSLTQLVLRNYSTSLVSINDNDMILITSMCPNLTRLKLCFCDRLTVFSKNCKELKEFSCANCEFSDLGMLELLDNCTQLEVLSVTWLVSRLSDDKALSNFRAAKSLKVIKVSFVCNERLFEPLIIASKNLKSLKLIGCGGKWDRALESIGDDNCLGDVHLEQVNVTDVGVSLLAKCRDLISLYIKNVLCTDVGLISVAENCKRLKKLYVDDCVRNKIGNEGLIAVGKHSVNLQELVLKGVSVSCVSLQVIATNCQKLVRLELSRSETITDVEMMCIAEKCVALKSLCIEECCVSNKGIEAFALGCPNLAKFRVTKCKKVTREVKDRLRASRESLWLHYIH